MEKEVICPCGKKMLNGCSTFGPLGRTSDKRCTRCGTKAIFFDLKEGMELVYSVQSKDLEDETAKKTEKLCSLFGLADIELFEHWNIQNEYDRFACDWVLARTSLGIIKIGWRKKVIAIEWGATNIKYLTDANVTKSEHGCHCYSYAEALVELTNLMHKSNNQ